MWKKKKQKTAITISGCVQTDITQETDFSESLCAVLECSGNSCSQNWVCREFDNCTCFSFPHCDSVWKLPYLCPVSTLLIFHTAWASEVCFYRALNLMKYEFSWSIKDLNCNYHRQNAVFQNPFSNWLVGISTVVLSYSCLDLSLSTYAITSHFFIIPNLYNTVLYTH